MVGLIGGSSPLEKAPWHHTGIKGLNVVHGWIYASDVTKELQMSGMDDVCEWWLVSASVDLFVKKCRHSRNS